MLDGILEGVAIPMMDEKGRFAKRGRPAGVKDAKSGTVIVDRRASPREQSKVKPARGQSPTARDPLANYTPRARVRFIGRQVCPVCGKNTEYIAGDLLEYAQGETVAGVRTIRTKAFPAGQSRFAYLPERTDFLAAESAECPECIRMGATFDAAVLGRGQVELALKFPEPEPVVIIHRDAPKVTVAPAGTVRKTKELRAREFVVPLLDTPNAAL